MSNLRLSAPQNIFLNGLNTKFRAYVGGFGSGKTFVGCLDLLIFASRYPKTVQGYFGISYPSIRDIFYPTLEEAAELMGYQVKIKTTDKEIELYRNGRFYGTIIARSMDNPSTIVGFKIARAMCDEIDTLPKQKAQDAWRKIIARMRLVIDGVENSIGVTTTPEGFRFVYEQFARNTKKHYSMVQASSYENAKNLPADYIESLLETYPENLVKAYVSGEFVNLTSGMVYNSYDRAKHRSRETIRPQEPLYIGLDFNKGKMAARVFVKRDNGWHCVDEINNGLDTPAVIETIRTKWALLGHKISIYPDSSGKNGSSKGASITDISLLTAAGFRCFYKETNPFVKDRVNAVNIAFQNGKIWVNDALAPRAADDLEQQIYDDNGEPDKKNDQDHGNDAFGYFVAYEMPIIKPIAQAPRIY